MFFQFPQPENINVGKAQQILKAEHDRAELVCQRQRDPKLQVAIPRCVLFPRHSILTQDLWLMKQAFERPTRRAGIFH